MAGHVRPRQSSEGSAGNLGPRLAPPQSCKVSISIAERCTTVERRTTAEKRNQSQVQRKRVLCRITTESLKNCVLKFEVLGSSIASILASILALSPQSLTSCSSIVPEVTDWGSVTAFELANQNNARPALCWDWLEQSLPVRPCAACYSLQRLPWIHLVCEQSPVSPPRSKHQNPLYVPQTAHRKSYEHPRKAHIKQTKAADLLLYAMLLLYSHSHFR